MKTRKINVTQEQINTAVKRDAHHCMIADAIKAQYPEAKYIHVDLQSVRFTDLQSGKRFEYFTPSAAQVALLKFDQGVKVRPFSFTLYKGRTRKVSVVHRGGKNYKKPTTRHPHPTREREFGLCKLVK